MIENNIKNTNTVNKNHTTELKLAELGSRRLLKPSLKGLDQLEEVNPKSLRYLKKGENKANPISQIDTCTSEKGLESKMAALGRIGLPSKKIMGTLQNLKGRSPSTMTSVKTRPQFRSIKFEQIMGDNESPTSESSDSSYEAERPASTKNKQAEKEFELPRQSSKPTKKLFLKLTTDDNNEEKKLLGMLNEALEGKESMIESIGHCEESSLSEIDQEPSCGPHRRRKPAKMTFTDYCDLRETQFKLIRKYGPLLNTESFDYDSQVDN